MKGTDRFLIIIVVGIILLVIVAFVVTLARPEATYQAEDTPEGVAHNYLLALQESDYERAYKYLSPEVPGYPASVDDFTRDITLNRWDFRLQQEATVEVQSAQVTGNRATVRVRESVFYGGDLFSDGGSESTFEIRLERIDGEWKIWDSDLYFSLCWSNREGC
jgi:hypothetical protein